MSKRTRILAAVMSTVVMTTALMGCGGSSSSSSESTASGSASGDQSLLVWSHLSTDEVNALRTVAEKWGTDNGCTVKVVEDKGEMQAAITALQSSKGPDLYFGLAHDNLGTYQKAGVLEEVPADMIKADDYSAPAVVDAITIGGKQYAIPLATECAALFYNADNVKEAPKSMEDVLNSGKFLFNAQDFYLAYGFMSAGGGYVFKNNDGTLDTEDIGLANDGAVAGFDAIKTLVDKDGMNPDVNDDIALAKFTKGETDYYISGPWKIADCKDVKNLAIVPLPTLGGKDMRPFMGVQAAFVSAKSKNKDLAWKLMQYLVDETGDILIEKGNRIPALKKAQESEKLKANKYADTFITAATNADPMPNIPEMQGIWEPGANALKAVVAGTAPKDAATKCVEDAKAKIASSK